MNGDLISALFSCGCQTELCRVEQQLYLLSLAMQFCLITADLSDNSQWPSSGKVKQLLSPDFLLAQHLSRKTLDCLVDYLEILQTSSVLEAFWIQLYFRYRNLPFYHNILAKNYRHFRVFSHVCIRRLKGSLWSVDVVKKIYYH